MNIITQNATYTQNINKSKFIGFSYYVTSESEAQNIIKEIENKYCDCRHVVYAYKIEPNIEKKGNSSEPAGTAGAPIFSAIEKNNLTNVLVVIVRYFGGILLGAQNLYRAYSTTALEVLNKSIIKERIKHFKCKLLCSYTEYNELVARQNKYADIKILKATFENEIQVELAYQKESFELLTTLINKQKPNIEEIWL